MGMSGARNRSRGTPIGSRNARAEPGLTFGPVPSRRFGRSLGINNIPPKVCTYSCVYCQVGRTIEMRCARRAFHGAATVAAAVRSRVHASLRAKEPVDYLTFVPDGEPTLDTGLGAAIHQLRSLGVRIAVITNGSLLSRLDVRAALAEADHVSVKVDAVREETWRKVNRPHRRLELRAILDGMRKFASGFPGIITSETMLVDGVNDGEEELRATAAFVGELSPETAYLAVPTRPPAEPWAVPPGEAALARAYEVFRTWHPRVEMLLGYEGDAFTAMGDPVADLLSITAVHPMREAAVRRLLDRGGTSRHVVSDLIEAGLLAEVRYGPHRYYLRPVGPRRSSPRAAGSRA